MRYMLIHAVDETRLGDLPPHIETELEAWVEEMVGRGIELDGARLHATSDATTVRAPGGDTQVTDGPFAETKEQIAGYDVIDCPDLDTALAVAAAHPTLHVGAIEVRAFEGEGARPPGPGDRARRPSALPAAGLRGHGRGAEEEETADADDAPDADDADEGDDDVDALDLRRGRSSPVRLAAGVHPTRAVTVRRVDGQVVTTDGPFAETKEQVAGFDLLECADLDDAIQVAAGAPGGGGRRARAAPASWSEDPVRSSWSSRTTTSPPASPRAGGGSSPA